MRLADSDSVSETCSEGENAEQAALDEILLYEETLMAAGISRSAMIRILDTLIDDGQSGNISTKCGARPRRSTAHFGNASKMRSLDGTFGNNCTSEWPKDVIQRICE